MANRFLRIAPAYYAVVLIVALGWIPFFPPPEENLGLKVAIVDGAFGTGLADPRRHQAGAAAVARRPGAQVTAEALRQHCRAALAAYKVPRHIVFVDATALPLTATGKLQRNRLPELFAGPAAAD